MAPLPQREEQHWPHTQSPGLRVRLLLKASASLPVKRKGLNRRIREVLPPLPWSVSFNLINHIMVRGRDGVTDLRQGQKETNLTILLMVVLFLD